jgi:hypothetical protein
MPERFFRQLLIFTALGAPRLRRNRSINKQTSLSHVVFITNKDFCLAHIGFLARERRPRINTRS